MKKWLFNLFLAGCVLVFASFGKYNGFLQEADTTPSKAPAHAALSFPAEDEHVKAPVVSMSSNVKITLDNYDNENQDDKPETSKKEGASGAYFTKFYTSAVSAYYCEYCKNSLRSARQIFNFISSRRYITLGVLRI